MAFDPTKYGATPVSQSSGGFDPTKYGATAVQQPQLQQKQPSFADSIWNGLAGVGKNIGADIQSAGDTVNSAISGTGQFAGKNPLERGFAAASGAASAIPKVAADVIPGGKQVLGAVGDITGGTVGAVGNAIGSIPAVQSSVQNHPQVAGAVESAANIGASAGNIAGTILGAKSVADLGNTAVNSLNTISKTSSGAKYVADAITPKPEPVIQNTPAFKDPSLLKIQDLISPKANAKEVKLAIAEGRIAPGQEPTLLRDGTRDQILPSDKVVQASKTVRSQIPGAENMSQPELHGALDAKIEQIATKLTPEMKAVALTDEITTNIQDAWDFLKQKQLDDPYTSTGANIEKLQSQFQTKFLDPISAKTFQGDMSTSAGIQGAAPSMNDLWDTAKAYDNSVPSNVKSANALSSDILQTQKSVWLQNRAILRNAINDAATGLGETSKKAFSDMSDMFNAQKGIQSSYKLPKEGAPSGVKSFMEKPGVRAVKTVAKVGLGVEGAKKLLTGEF